MEDRKIRINPEVPIFLSLIFLTGCGHRRAVLPVLLSGLVLLVALLLLPIVVFAQERGAITGRVVADDGKALAGITVFLSASGADRTRGISRSTSTDEDGHFQFNGLPDRNYFVSASQQKGYVAKPPAPDEQRQSRFRPGDSLTITMMRGGVITGRVTNADGDPLVNILVIAIRTRDQEGNKTTIQSGGLPRTTDDRGVYRIYGLMPGAYIVVANLGASSFGGATSPYYGEAPTYHPSSTRDTAAEVKVTGGDEATGIDIRYRAEPGHAISGKVTRDKESPATNPGASAPPTASPGTSISLRHAVTGATVGNGFVQPGQDDGGFAIYGVPDGEYELTANSGGGDSDEVFFSEPRRVTVKGSDVTDVNPRLIQTATIAGRVVVEKSPTICDAKLKTSIEDLSVFTRRDESGENNSNLARLSFSRAGSPDEKGDFKISGLVPGRHRLQANLPNETWFIKAINGPAPAAQTARPATARPAAAPTAAIDLARANLPLKAGEKYSGVAVAVTDGGASLRGKVVPAREGGKLPQRVQVHLIPAEPTAVNDLLRFVERFAVRDGAFTFTNVAPGKYWLLARALPEVEPSDRQQPAAALPVAWDTAERVRLLKEAEAAKNEIELKTCQRAKDHVLRF